MATTQTVQVELNPPLGQDSKDEALAAKARVIITEDLRKYKASPGSKAVWEGMGEVEPEQFQVVIQSKMRPTGEPGKYYAQAQAGFLKPGKENWQKFTQTKSFDPSIFQSAWTVTYIIQKDGDNWKIAASGAKKIF